MKNSLFKKITKGYGGKSVFFLSVFILVSLSAFSQYGQKLYRIETGIEPADSQQLFLRMGASTFVNNNEFFNDFWKGYTLIGYFVNPELVYHPNPRTRVRIGGHFLQYAGLDDMTQAFPTFTLEHRFSPLLQVVAGSIYGTLNHRLIEPVFNFERFFTDYQESGLQFLFTHNFFEADIWLNWERFIFTGDPFQEEFTAGLSSSVFAWDSHRAIRAEVPVQLLATHKGGQINVSDERGQTLINFASGFSLIWDLPHPFFRDLQMHNYFVLFRDLSNEFRYPFEKGWGIYPNLYLRTDLFHIGAGYWWGNGFVAPRGQPLFMSVSQVDEDFHQKRRQLMTAKVIYHRKLGRGIDLGVRFESYFDPVNSEFDHTTGLHIFFSQQFFITKISRIRGY